MDGTKTASRARGIARLLGFAGATATAAVAATAATRPALAQDTPAYATAADETIKGTIASVGGKFAISVNDERGYLDRVALHAGTVIVPTGVSLAAGQAVTIHGHTDGKTFAADEIDTDGAGDAPYDGGYGYAPAYGTIGGGYAYPAYGTPYYGGGYYGSGMYAPGYYPGYGTYGGVYYAPGTTIITAPAPAPAAPAAPVAGGASRGIVPGPLPYVRHAPAPPQPFSAPPAASPQRLAPPPAAPRAGVTIRSAPATRR